jgi:polar amino acid transport system ATP-binding protein
MPLVEIDDVRKSFGALTVLDGVSLDIAAGEVVAIIGRSGSGKSTLLRCINGLETIDDGAITVAGRAVSNDPRHLRELRQTVGMVFQSYNLFPHLTAGENVMLAPTVVKKTPKAEAAALAREMLARVGLAEKHDAYPEKLSGGQQQRVAIARSLAMRPSVMLCDEITSALDPELVGEVLRVVEQLARDGMTMILVTHEMNFARGVCDTLAFMHQGKVWEKGPPAALFATPVTQELAQFTGSAP